MSLKFRTFDKGPKATLTFDFGLRTNATRTFDYGPKTTRTFDIELKATRAFAVGAEVLATPFWGFQKVLIRKWTLTLNWNIFQLQMSSFLYFPSVCVFVSVLIVCMFHSFLFVCVLFSFLFVFVLHLFRKSFLLPPFFFICLFHFLLSIGVFVSSLCLFYSCPSSCVFFAFSSILNICVCLYISLLYFWVYLNPFSSFCLFYIQ